MGMGLFYVTVFGFFSVMGMGQVIGDFALFLRGVPGKVTFLMWCFCGAVVVNCVSPVEGSNRIVWRLKTRHEFEVYFSRLMWKSRRRRFRFGNGALKDSRVSDSLG
jgi:hypothetical protein